MKKIGVKKNMHFKDIKEIVKDLLLEDELVACDCLVENAGATTARIGIGVFCGIGLTFNDYASQFKVVATNKRLLLVGISNTVDLVTGVRVIEYDEIKSLKMGKDMHCITLTLNDGKFFELEPLDFSDNKSIMEKSIRTFEYISSCINKQGVTITNNTLNSKYIFLAIYSAVIVLSVLLTYINILK